MAQSIGNIGTKGIVVAPKFIFGIAGHLKNNLYIIDDNKLLYVAGHNVIIFNTEETTQTFIPGSENTECINFITVSPGKKFLAICERGQVRAQCSIINLQHCKRQKVIPEAEQEVDYKAKEFLGVAFCPKDEKRHMVTLCGEPDYCVLLWQHDVFKMLARINLNIPEPPIGNSFNISYVNMSTHFLVAVTGPGCFKWFKVADGMNEFSVIKSELEYENGSKPDILSDNFTCHRFDTAGKMHLATAKGEIMICDHSGNLQYYLEDAPFSNGRDYNRIECIYPASRGLVVAGQFGQIWSYESKQFSDGAPYALLQSEYGIDPIQWDIESEERRKEWEEKEALNTIYSLNMSETEDYIYTVNRSNQLQQVQFSYDREKGGPEEPRLKPVHSVFHSQTITGMDICLRKQLVVTTSGRYINIWNYNTKRLEICHQCQAGEETAAVAFHPSGFHIIVAFADKIQFMNVLSRGIKEYSQGLQLKGCREIRFSNGGHMFAASFASGAINVYSFYSMELPQNMMSKNHSNKVRCIEWFEDDTGFASCAMDGNVYFYDIQQLRQTNNRMGDCDFWQKGVIFTGLCNIPGQITSALVVGSDKHIYKASQTDSKSCQTKVTLSQVQYLASGKAFFAGVGEENRPGAIQIWKSSLEKINEIQAHGKGVERMRISYDNNYLFTAGRDGTFIIHSIQDQDPRGGVTKRDLGGGLITSEEILTEKQEMEEFDSMKEQLENELQAARDPANTGVDNKMDANDQDKEIEHLSEKLAHVLLTARRDHEVLNSQKQDMIENREKQLKILAEQQHEELEGRRNEYNQKMLEDASRYDELQMRQKMDHEAFTVSCSQIVSEHEQLVNMHSKNHSDYIDKQTALILDLKENIAKMVKDNAEMMKQINEDGEEELERMERNFKQNLQQVIDMGLTSKADLQNKRSKREEINTEIGVVNRQISDKTTQLEAQKKIIEDLKEEMQTYDKEIIEKEKQITDRELIIYQYKKKTQELDKFKFVLEHKIQSLKKDIAPREADINELREKTRKMDGDLKKKNLENEQLGFSVNRLRTDQQILGEVIAKQRNLIKTNNNYIRKFRTSVHDVVKYIDDHDQLKYAVSQKLHKEYCKDAVRKSVQEDPDIAKEHKNQKKYLDSSHHSLQMRLQKEEQIHREDNLQVMKENANLIEEITRLRQEVDVQHKEWRKLKGNEKKEDAGQQQRVDQSQTSMSQQQQSQEQQQNMERLMHMQATVEENRKELAAIKGKYNYRVKEYQKLRQNYEAVLAQQEASGQFQ